MNSHFFGKLLCVILAAFAVSYTGWLAYRYLVPTYRTETVFSYTVADSCRVRAVAVREEQVLTSSEQGVYDYLREDGEVILKSTVIANVYDSAQDLALQNLCDRYDQEIEALESAQSSSGQPLLTETLGAEINEAAGTLVDSVARGDLSGLSAQRGRLQLLLGKKLIASGKQIDFSARIASLLSQKESAKAQITGNPAAITAGKAGYFCSSTDGYETLLPENIDELTVQDVRGVLDGTTKALEYANAVGKVQEDFRWNLAFFVDEEQAEEFSPGASVTLNFGVADATSIPAAVTLVKPDGADVLIVLTCDRLSRYLMNLRIASVEVRFKSYSGLRVPKNAVRYREQEEGVYVKSGNLVEFKPIERLYEDEAYLICSDMGSAENALEQFDEVIVEGADLYDGKILA